ncbi:MAG: hypothetical protein GF331_27150 [Chitinivibrionales bacterium]|nr:hypothetical protein [Chitinivibrionales bacterium]
MNVTLPLDRMSTADKIRTMEALWEDLCRKCDELPSPSWHSDALADRADRLEEGKEQLHDWETAKSTIREAGS